MKKRTILITTTYSFLFSLAVLFSLVMPVEFKTVSWLGLSTLDIIKLLLIWIISTLCFMLVNRILDWMKLKQIPFSVTPVAVYLIIFIAWLPFWLSFYPGNLSPDSYSSIKQSLNGITSTAHPVLFTLLVKVCVQTGLHVFGNMNAGIAVFSVVQMLLLDGILTYTVFWLKKHNVSRLLLLLTIAYFVLNPLIVRYSFTMWKDILFSGVILLLVLCLYDLVTGAVTFDDMGTIIRFLVLATLAAFLRNRIIYAVIAIFIVLLIVYRTQWKRLLPTFTIVSVLILFIQGPGYQYLNIKSSNFAEGQGVSLQQIAAVVVNDGDMTEEERSFINQIIPLEDIPDAYCEHTVDSLKGYETFDHDFLNAHAGEYLKVWRSVVMKNPWISIKAWLMTTRAFWGFNVWVEPFAITWPSEELDIYQVNIIQNLTGIDLSYFSDGVLVHIGKVPVVGWIFQLGTLGWFGAFVCLRIIIKRRYKILLALAPLVALWLVLIATTPLLFEARYMFAFNLALPVLGCILLMGEQMERVERIEKCEVECQ